MLNGRAHHTPWSKSASELVRLAIGRVAHQNTRSAFAGSRVTSGRWPRKGAKEDCRVNGGGFISVLNGARTSSLTRGEGAKSPWELVRPATGRAAHRKTTRSALTRSARVRGRRWPRTCVCLFDLGRTEHFAIRVRDETSSLVREKC